MSERQVSVKLTADTGQYVAGMKSAERATDQLGSTSTTNFTKLGTQATNVGRRMTAAVTLPVLGVGTAAVKMSNDFDTAFSQMVGLAGVPADEIDRLKESVLDLAGETARSPQELAEALYFASSAGLDAAQAMDAVTLAAKASAAGLGPTQDVVGLVASAVASYGAENISAAEATDILTSAIREGRAEPTELAGALGRVLPVAASLGVTFGEVGGTVAYLSNIFGDTDRTVTAVNDTFAKLAAPTDSARDVLDRMGTSAEELQSTIRDDGLLAGLELLREHGFRGNAAAIRELMPDMQGAAALTALLDDASGQLSDKLMAVSDSTGSMQQAFGAIDPDAQKMKQSWVDIQVALIQLGEVIGPVIADMAGGIADIVGWFSELDPAAQAVIGTMVGLAAAAGPVLMVFGSILRNVQTLQTAMGSKFTGAIGGVTLALTVAVGAYTAYNDRKQEAVARTEALVAALESEADGHEMASSELLNSIFSTKQWADAIDAAGVSVADITRFIQGEQVPAVAALMEQQNEIVGGTGEWGLASLGLRSDLSTLINEIEHQRSAMGDARTEVEAATAADAELAAAAKDLGDKHANMAPKVDMGTDALTALLQAEADAAEQTVDLGDKWSNTMSSVGAGGAVIRAVADQLQDLQDELRRTADATFDLHDAELAFEQAITRAKEAAEDSELTMLEQRAALEDVARAADTVAQSQVDLAGETLDSKAGMDIWVESMINSANTLSGPLREEVLNHISRVSGIPTNVLTQISAQVDSASLAAIEADLNWTARNRFVRFSPTGGVPRYASGVLSHPGGLAVVGEQGPELVNLPAGSRVYNASDTAMIANKPMAPINASPGGGEPMGDWGAPHVELHGTFASEQAVLAGVNRALAMARLSR